MEEDKKFRTKSGFCHVLPDKIVLTRNGVVGSVSSVLVGNGIARVLVIYTLVSALFFYMAYTFFVKENYLSGAIFAVVALLLVISVIASLNNSGAPVIERGRIVKVGFIRGVPGMTRSRFEVFFRNAANRTQKRVIMMPGSLNGEKEENEKALRIMKEEGLIDF